MTNVLVPVDPVWIGANQIEARILTIDVAHHDSIQKSVGHCTDAFPD